MRQMNSLLKIITIFSAFFICSCLNFYTSSSLLNDNEIDKKYIGLYEAGITTTDSYNITYQAYVSVTISSGGVATVNISGGYISFLNNIYKEDMVKLSDNSYSASITSSGYRYYFTFTFSDYALNFYFDRNDGTKGSGNLTKVR